MKTYLSHILLLTSTIQFAAVSAIDAVSDSRLRGGHTSPDAVKLLDFIHDNKQTEYAATGDRKNRDFLDNFCKPSGSLCLRYPTPNNCCSSRCVLFENSDTAGRCE